MKFDFEINESEIIDKVKEKFEKEVSNFYEYGNIEDKLQDEFEELAKNKFYDMIKNVDDINKMFKHVITQEAIAWISDNFGYEDMKEIIKETMVEKMKELDIMDLVGIVTKLNKEG